MQRLNAVSAISVDVLSSSFSIFEGLYERGAVIYTNYTYVKIPVNGSPPKAEWEPKQQHEIEMAGQQDKNIKVLAFLFGRALDRYESLPRHIDEDLQDLCKCTGTQIPDNFPKSYKQLRLPSSGIDSEARLTQFAEQIAWKDNFIMQSIRKQYVEALTARIREQGEGEIIPPDSNPTRKKLAKLVLQAVWAKVETLNIFNDDNSRIPLQLLANQNAVRAMFRRRGPTSYSILTKAAHPNKEMKNQDFVKVVFSLAKKTPIEVAEEDFDLLHVLESRATDIDASLKTYIDVSSL